MACHRTHRAWTPTEEDDVNDGHLFCDSPEWRATVRDEIIPWAVRDVDLGDDVLEIGPGYGATTDAFATVVPRLTSVEIDPDLAARLQSRYAGTHVEVVLGDASAVTFPDARFTGAVCFSMLHHVPSPELQDRVFAETARVLREPVGRGRTDRPPRSHPASGDAALHQDQERDEETLA